MPILADQRRVLSNVSDIVSRAGQFITWTGGVASHDSPEHSFRLVRAANLIAFHACHLEQFSIADDLLADTQQFLLSGAPLASSDLEGALKDTATNRSRIYWFRMGHDAYCDMMHEWLESSKLVRNRNGFPFGLDMPIDPDFELHLKIDVGVHAIRSGRPAEVPSNMFSTPIGRELLWRSKFLRGGEIPLFQLDKSKTFKHELHRLLVYADSGAIVDGQLIEMFSWRFAKEHESLKFVCLSTPLLWLATLARYCVDDSVLAVVNSEYNRLWLYVKDVVDKNLSILLGCSSVESTQFYALSDVIDAIRYWFNGNRARSLKGASSVD